MHTLTENARFARVLDGAAAGQGTSNGTGVDMTGYHRVIFVAALGAITATGTVTLKAQQSSDDGVADAYADLDGASVAADDQDGDKLLILEIPHPRKRYVRPVLVRAVANAVIDGIVAIQGEPMNAPVTQPATVAASAVVHAPAEAV